MAIVAMVFLMLVCGMAAFGLTPPVYPLDHTEKSTVTVSQNGQNMSISGFSAYSASLQSIRWSGQTVPGSYGLDVYQNFGPGGRSAMVVQNLTCAEWPAPPKYADPLAAMALMQAAGTATVNGVVCDVWKLSDDGVRLTVYADAAAPTTPVRSVAQIAVSTAAGQGELTQQIDYISFRAGASADLFALPSASTF